MTLIDEVRASAYTIPTDRPESEGTLAWDSTTLVVVEVRAGDVWGLGYSYAEAGAAGLARRMLVPPGGRPRGHGRAWRLAGHGRHRP